MQFGNYKLRDSQCKASYIMYGRMKRDLSDTMRSDRQHSMWRGGDQQNGRQCMRNISIFS